MPQERTLGVAERVTFDGQVQQALTTTAVAEAVDGVLRRGEGPVAVCLLHAYANADRERRLGEALSQHVVHVSLSHRVNPEAREFERTTSTVLNAAATPVVVDYLDALLDRLDLTGRFQLFHSAGGWATPEAVRERHRRCSIGTPSRRPRRCACGSTRSCPRA